MPRVSKSGFLSLYFLLALAGCSTGRRSFQTVTPDWTAASSSQAKAVEPEFEQVPNGPTLAPPPASAPPHAVSKPATPSWISLARWNQVNHVGHLRQISPEPQAIYEIATAKGGFEIEPGSLVARWRGVELHLGFAPELIHGQPFVRGLDLEKNIEPLIEPTALPAAGRRVIVLDPGHGGENTGTRSVLDGALEKDFTLDWARRLQRLLTDEGWQVFLTRAEDRDVSLSNRVAFTEAHHADLFISLHFNSAAPSQEQHGLETYCLTPAGMPSTLTRGYEDDVSSVFPNNSFDGENLEFAFLLHSSLLPVVGADRGIRRARFLGVLRGQRCPAILIEGGYLSNPDEARRIADPNYREKMAEAVAGALKEDGVANLH